MSGFKDLCIGRVCSGLKTYDFAGPAQVLRTYVLSGSAQGLRAYVLEGPAQAFCTLQMPAAVEAGAGNDT